MAANTASWANVNPDVPHPRWSQGERAAARLGPEGADQNLQWLWRFRRRLVFRSQVREAVHVTAYRILAVLAAALFVGAVALATTGPGMVSLRAALTWLTSDNLENLQGWVARVLGAWAWTYIVQPLLIRPAWLPVASLGLVCAGWRCRCPGAMPPVVPTGEADGVPRVAALRGCTAFADFPWAATVTTMPVAVSREGRKGETPMSNHCPSWRRKAPTRSRSRREKPIGGVPAARARSSRSATAPTRAATSAP